MPKYAKKRKSKGKSPSKITKYYKKSKASSSRKSTALKSDYKRRTSKKYSLNQSAKKTGTSSWMSFGIGCPPGSKNMYTKILKLLGNPYTEFTNSVGQSIPTTGIQTVVKISSSLAPYPIFNIFPVALGYDVTAPCKYLIDSYSRETTFSNQSNATCFIELYDFVAREDLAPNSGATSDNKDPVLTWTNDYTTNAPGLTVYGTNFFDSPVTCSLYKVKKITKIRLGAGETHQHVVRGKPRKLIEMKRLQNFQSTNLTADDFYGLENITSYTCAIFRYQPTDADDTTVTASKGKIDWVTVKRTVCRAMTQPSAVANVWTNALTTADTQHVMETDGDDNLVITA